VEDVHIILGPSINLKKYPEDYRDDVSAAYDFENPLANVVEMHDLFEQNKRGQATEETKTPVQP